MKVYSLGRKPFIVNHTGYGIIFQKCLSITCEELFKGWNRWMTGESTPPPLQYNSQKLGTSLWSWELISLLGCSRGNISITCSLPGAGYNSILDKMCLEKLCVSEPCKVQKYSHQRVTPHWCNAYFKQIYHLSAKITLRYFQWEIWYWRDCSSIHWFH